MVKDQIIFKFILLGDSGVGKSCVFSAFNGQLAYFSSPTISPDVASRIVTSQCTSLENVSSSLDIVCQLWDTAGQERFRSMSIGYFRGVHCCLLMFDIGCRQSFNSCKTFWQRYIAQHTPPGTKILLIGNKNDIRTKSRVSDTEAKDYAEQEGFIGYFSCSILVHSEVPQLLVQIIQNHLWTPQEISSRHSLRKQNNTVKINKEETEMKASSSNCCCL
jgi:small GTP-binding protein